jgi:hypothetical protein
MKKTFPAVFVLVFIGLSGFIKESTNYEQLTFDYFVYEIAKTDFKGVTSFEFKGKTEESYASLGSYKFCLKPDKLGSIISTAAKGERQTKEIKHKSIQGLSIVDFQRKADSPRIFVYPSLHVADNYYVFVVVQKQKEKPAKYVFELTPEGSISRSCTMD